MIPARLEPGESLEEKRLLPRTRYLARWRGGGRLPVPPAEVLDQSNTWIYNPTMNFFLFILLNAAFFIRPGELFPSLEVPLYNYLVIVCLAVSAGRIVARILSLSRTPIAACVLGDSPAPGDDAGVQPVLWQGRRQPV